MKQTVNKYITTEYHKDELMKLLGLNGILVGANTLDGDRLVITTREEIKE